MKSIKGLKSKIKVFAEDNGWRECMSVYPNRINPLYALNAKVHTGINREKVIFS